MTPIGRPARPDEIVEPPCVVPEHVYTRLNALLQAKFVGYGSWVPKCEYWACFDAPRPPNISGLIDKSIADYEAIGWKWDMAVKKTGLNEEEEYYVFSKLTR